MQAPRPNQLDAFVMQLQERCHRLGLPSWRCDGEGTVMLWPGPFGESDRWLMHDVLTETIRDTATRLLEASDPKPEQLVPGCWLIPLMPPRRVRRGGMHLVMVLTPEALGGAWFKRCVREAGLDVESARKACVEELSGLDGKNRHDVQQLATMLGWMLHDLLTGQEDQQSIVQFSEKLIQSYEELNLVYRLSASMRNLTDPQHMLHNTCEQLLAVLPFEWVGAVFSQEAIGLNDLAGQVVWRGELPGEGAWFVSSARSAFEHYAEEMTEEITLLHEGDLARGADTEVVMVPIESGGRVVGSLLAGGKRGDDGEHEVCSAEIKMLRASGDFLGVFIENASAYEEQRTLFLGTLKALSATIDAKDHYTRGHSERVALLAKQLALAVGFSEEDAHKAHIAGLVHDIGKVGVSEQVLGKTGRLTDSEFEQIQRHPVIGHHILQDIPPLADMLDGVLYHHERFDGRGYPEGLLGTDIPLLGRLIAVCDMFDAMSSTRSYRDAVPRDEVFAEMRRAMGTQLDPHLARAFLTLDLSEYDATLARHQSVDRLAA